jgi:alpha-glucosidase (family GH31 glycosyl hydrolase)
MASSSLCSRLTSTFACLSILFILLVDQCDVTVAYRIVIDDARAVTSPTDDGHLKERVHISAAAADGVNCTRFLYETVDCTEDEIEVCYTLTGANWYGGTAIREMKWPIENWNMPSMPFVTGDGYTTEYGGLVERYFFNSAGLALYIDWDTPLWVSVNSQQDGLLCLKARYKDSLYPNVADARPALNYTECVGRDVRHVHDHMTSSYLARPTDIPDERMIRYPIWSTWAQYKADIDQTQVLEFADAILANGFNSSQVEIDDRWETHYGDMTFDPVKFPDPRGMTDYLHGRGMRATLWVHPFVNLDSVSLLDGVTRRVFVSDPALLRLNQRPGVTLWWAAAGSMAMIVDFTDPNAVTWYTNRLKSLQVNYGIDSFKFDAGETNWLPRCFQLAELTPNPSYYTTTYVQMAYDMDSQVRHQEVRVGAQTQHLPVFVRMMDKDSRWDSTNGLATLIPHTLVFGLLGYPFVLPDMIGGNAYGFLPDRELFIRWTELNVFLPSVQFSIVPWQFDAELLQITRDMMALRDRYAQTLIDLARESTLTGAPIIRPLWWIAPSDPVALSIDSEFLVGDSLLVAPVVVQGATSRDVYLPAGTWQDELRGGTLTGGQWLTNYRVELNELAYFTRI